MAHQAIPPLDGFSFVACDDPQHEASERGQIGVDETTFSLVGNRSFAKASRTSLADLALDLVLNEIVQQARLTTTATGAAIRLVRGGDVVCRAAAGATATEIAAYLKLRGGIAGACLQTGRVQRCDDTEADSRLDATSCRRLGLRAILMVPIRNGDQEMLGVIEIFSARARTFSDRDVLTLQALARRVVANIDLLARMLPAAADPVVTPSTENRLRPEFCGADSSPGLVLQTGTYARNRMSVLWLVLVASALLVGWMLGRAGREKADVPVEMKPEVSHAERPAVKSSAIALNVAATVTEKAIAIAPVSGPSTIGSKVAAVLPNAIPAKISKVRGPGKATLKESLVVYESGKTVPERQPRSNESSPAAVGGASVPAASIHDTSTSSDVSGHPLWLPEEIADANLFSRVDSQYPKSAIEQHIQGRVVLDVDVSRRGVVLGVHPVSGQALLTTAAVDALQQWRFRPYYVKGKPMNFETHIALNFALP
jgi:TonB family protein